MAVSVCVCLSASVSPELHVRPSPIFARYPWPWLGGAALCYVLPVFMDDVMFAHNDHAGICDGV